MAAKFPYLLRNVNRIQCTNSIHRIYFKKLSATEKKWIQISLLSVAGQLSLEAYSKTYGRGILKIEPSSLKRTLVLKKSDKTINTIFSEVERMLLENDRIGAMRIATDFINKQLAIPTQLSIEAENALYQFQAHRLSSTESQQNSQPRSEPIVVMVF